MFRVAIVGRPNTGKSTLFNRLIKRSKSVTWELPGTTRDYVYGEGNIGDKKVSFLDTGGISFEESELTEKIRLQVQLAIEEADLVLFVVDGSIAIVPEEDKKIANMLHKSKKEVIIVANKCDIGEKCLDPFIFMELGFGAPTTISALKGKNLDELLELIDEKIPEVQREPSMYPRVAIIGKPNVGKSTLLNTILGKERSIVSDTPGTTRDIIENIVEIEGEKYVFLDTPGMRRGKLNKFDFVISLRSLRGMRESDICLFTIDPADVSRTDEHLAGLLYKNKKSGIIVMNKLDIVNREEIEKYLNEAAYRLRPILFYPSVMISALKKENLHLLFKLLKIVRDKIERKFSDSTVLKTILSIVTKNPPPRKGKRFLKIYDARIIKKNPKTILIIVNFPDIIKDDYKRYLTSKFREKFDLKGVFIDIIFKKREKR